MNDKNLELNAYLMTVDRLEHEITMIDKGYFYASAAISLKRIADYLDKITDVLVTRFGEPEPRK